VAGIVGPEVLGATALGVVFELGDELLGVAEMVELVRVRMVASGDGDVLVHATTATRRAAIATRIVMSSP
jgi:hypothetical protein